MIEFPYLRKMMGCFNTPIVSVEFMITDLQRGIISFQYSNCIGGIKTSKRCEMIESVSILQLYRWNTSNFGFCENTMPKFRFFPIKTEKNKKLSKITLYVPLYRYLALTE